MNLFKQSARAAKRAGVICLLLPLVAWAASPSNTDVVLETSHGNIVLELYPDNAPTTVANFLHYLESGLYDGTIFHRVAPGFVIQGGGFTADLEKRPTYDPIANEASNGLGNYRGTIVMARTSDPDSATSQFFINLVDNDFLDYSELKAGYAVFGEVKQGMDIIDAIASAATHTVGNLQNVPVAPITISRVLNNAISGAGWLTISPPSGSYISSQQIDLVLIVKAPGSVITGGRVLFNGIDVTAVVAACLQAGSLIPDGGVSLRCPGLNVWDLGLGTHKLEVSLEFSGGASVSDEVIWEVIESAE